MQLYMLSISSITGAVVPYAQFRPTKIVTSVDAPDKGRILQLYFNEKPQFINALDAWFCSPQFMQQVYLEFLERHGLIGERDRVIDAYCDEHGLSIPEPNRFVLPPLEKGDRIRIETEGEFNVMISGFGER